MEESIAVLRHLGSVRLLIRLIYRTSSAYDGSEYVVLLYEFKADLNAYLANMKSGTWPMSLAELIEFNVANAARVMPYFGQEIFLQAQQKGPLERPSKGTPSLKTIACRAKRG